MDGQAAARLIIQRSARQEVAAMAQHEPLHSMQGVSLTDTDWLRIMKVGSPTGTNHCNL